MDGTSTQDRGGGIAQALSAHTPALRALAFRLCGNKADADDLVQDALERGLRGAGRLPEGSNLKSWLLAVLHHRFIDLCRRRARRPRETPIEDLPVAAPPPEEPPAWAHLGAAEVHAALERLGDEHRRVYELHVVEKRSYEEIAAILGIPRATVGTRLLRARRRLRDLLRAGVVS